METIYTATTRAEAEQQEYYQLEQALLEQGSPRNRTAEFVLAKQAFFAEIAETTSFDITHYLQERLESHPWRTVDIGPGTNPSGLNRSFAGDNEYVAFEPCLNHFYAKRRDVEQVYVDILAARPGEHILLRDVPHLKDPATGKLTFQGTYNYPDGRACEVFIANVFDDNTPCTDAAKDAKIIAEVYRMLRPGGVFIIQDRAANMVQWLGNALREQGFDLVFGQDANPGRTMPNYISPAAYQKDFTALVTHLGLHYQMHEHLSLLIAQKPGSYIDKLGSIASK